MLAKGRGNYVSLRRLQSAHERAQSLFSNDEEIDAVGAVHRWATDSRDGSRSDLDFAVAPAVWDEIASDSGNCMGRKCPSYKDCFYYRARRRMQNAEVLVVNHALFFVDLGLRRLGVNLLPDYDSVILDEAHMVEQVAGDHLGLTLSHGQVDYALNKLYNIQRNRGLLVHHPVPDGQRLVEQALYASDAFFNDILAWASRTAGESRSLTLRVRQAGIVQNKLSPALDRLAACLRAAATEMASDTERQDFAAAVKRLEALSAVAESWRLQSDAKLCLLAGVIPPQRPAQTAHRTRRRATERRSGAAGSVV